MRNFFVPLVILSGVSGMSDIVTGEIKIGWVIHLWIILKVQTSEILKRHVKYLIFEVIFMIFWQHVIR